ncbi:Alpha/Beta hydrolase protein [Mycena rosella]|uniref:Alpha/Beta hydrolase protein n=1 Tax=Mycena rosella TaxID=1033263 RepID=A0AAD7CW21_MYCRO|nr:Alpha/Beta hydrolase protein [Mycena rosella]
MLRLPARGPHQRCVLRGLQPRLPKSTLAARLELSVLKGVRFCKFRDFRDFTAAGWAPLWALVPIAPVSDTPSILLVISVFIGLPAALWAYKCLMLVLFQRKIIYMGYVPPGSRHERLTDVHPSHLKSIECEKIFIPTMKKCSLSGIAVSTSRTASVQPDMVIIYFQGNAGNPLHRLPVFQTLLAPPNSSSSFPNIKILAVAPRSYWKSTPNRPTQLGILADYTAILAHALSTYPRANLTVYAHSLGGAAAVCLLAQLQDGAEPDGPDYSRIRGLVLENPFASIPGMVRALYPQRWLPYHYLAPLAWDPWDATGAMAAAQSSTGAPQLSLAVRNSVLARLVPDMLVLLSAHDEIVPNAMGEALHALRHAGSGKLVVIPNALHDSAWKERAWRVEMQRYITDVQMRART